MKIAEVVTPIIAYHGTMDDITQFRPLTHFGTEKAARDRMDYKKNKNGKVYKVQLDIRNPFTIKDFAGNHYDRVYAFDLRDKKKISQEEMEAITFIQDPTELRTALLAKVKELGYDGFVYKNRYEDKGNLSYVILDPSQAKILEVIPVGEEVTEDDFTFNQKRRPLNIPELIKRGAIFITHPHGPSGWETNRPDRDFSLITLQNVLQRSPDWSVEYKKYIRPESYNAANQKFFDKLSDQKYNQILWSIKKLSIPDNVAFVDVQENFADGKVKGKSRPGRVKRAGASCKGSVTDLRAKARKYGGEKGKMYHWCANMKGGKK